MNEFVYNTPDISAVQLFDMHVYITKLDLLHKGFKSICMSLY